MPFDYKKEFKEFYLPPAKPKIVHIPKMQFVAVRGKGNPNEEDGEYKSALAVQYAIEYTIKMSKKGEYRIEGYQDFVVPPLEGFWWQEENGAPVLGFDYTNKSSFNWISVIRLPDFVTQKDIEWAKKSVEEKKGLDCSRAELFTFEEGDCVQIMHIGSYDEEPATIKLMDEFAANSGYELDFSDTRLHHEIYLSDPRKTPPEKLKTVIRHPIRKSK
ncbi:MAG: GyrI-like domain-containing protein [Treponema sp.]|nr:GyrI-like domain-containing protein [Treponema sp.]